MSKYPTISDQPDVQAAYESMRRKGQSHSMAEMLALRTGPALWTDGTVYRRPKTLHDQFSDEKTLRRVVNAARKQGYEPNMHDQYDPTLATRRGDPAAFIPHGDRRRAIERAQRRLRRVLGRRQPNPLTRRRLLSKMGEKVLLDPERKRNLRDVRDEVIAQHQTETKTLKSKEM